MVLWAPQTAHLVYEMVLLAYTGRSFGPTRRAFGTTTGWFFIGQLCRFFVGRRRVLLCTAVRTEVGSLVRKLRAAVRTEVGRFVEELRATVRAKPLFFGAFLGQCGVLSRSAYLSSGTRIPVSLTVPSLRYYRSRTSPLAIGPGRTMLVAVVALLAEFG